jgi:hypothetical protein
MDLAACLDMVIKKGDVPCLEEKRTLALQLAVSITLKLFADAKDNTEILTPKMCIISSTLWKSMKINRN